MSSTTPDGVVGRRQSSEIWIDAGWMPVEGQAPKMVVVMRGQGTVVERLENLMAASVKEPAQAVTGSRYRTRLPASEAKIGEVDSPQPSAVLSAVVSEAAPALGRVEVVMSSPPVGKHVDVAVFCSPPTTVAQLQEALVDSGLNARRLMSAGPERIDKVVAKVAEICQLPTLFVPAEWDRDGSSAGKNRQECLLWLADAVLILWDKRDSKRLTHIIEQATLDGKLVSVYDTAG
ncbi:MAG TPA: hypothetical protein VKU87_00270 [Thermomicrobiaceae bacterium]|nr:hypothetical protein [Thermomicrobiaceae bacterium]